MVRALRQARRLLPSSCQDDAPHLITNVPTTDATVTDADVTETVQTRLADRRLSPAVHLVDSGYMSAALLVAAAGQNIDLMGPVLADTTAQGRAGGGFAKDTFTVDWTDRTVCCPRGARSVHWSEQQRPSGTPIIQVRFAGATCDACPVRAQCTTATGGTYGRRLTLLAQPLQQALDQRRREQENGDWKAAYGARAGIEGTISQAVRVTRTRTTPYRGLPKTRLGHVLIATGLNLRRLDAWWTGTPIGTTRITHLARLGLELAA